MDNQFYQNVIVFVMVIIVYQVVQESKWFQQSCHIPDRLRLTPLDLHQLQMLKDILWNEKPSSAVCGNLTCYEISRLACNRWVTEDLLQSVCDIINQSQQKTLCLTLSEFNKTRLPEYTTAAVGGKQGIRLIFMVVNVQINALSGTAMGSNKLLTGNHWVVVAYDLDAKVSFYCDPLGYPIPSNLAVEIQHANDEVEKILGEHLSFPLTEMHSPRFDANGRHVCSRHCYNFPVQACSSACGVIAMCFLAVASFCPSSVWQHLCSTKQHLCSTKLDVDMTRLNLTLFYQVSQYAPLLRKILASWILVQRIDISNMVDTRVQMRRQLPLKITKRKKIEWDLVDLPQKVLLTELTYCSLSSTNNAICFVVQRCHYSTAERTLT